MSRRKNNDEELTEALNSIEMEYWFDMEGIEYKKAHGSSGEQLNVKECPCCGNSNWKVYVNAETGLGNCFVCEEGLNKWKFIRNSLGGSNRDVVNHIKESAKEQGWRPVRKKKAVATDSDVDLKVPGSFPLPWKGRNCAYLTNRGISSETAEYFKLRLCVNGVFPYELNGKKLKQSYKSRLIIPVFDLNGDMVTFQGRDITGTAERKYLFPPGFASTGSILYNGVNAIGVKHVVIGEGAFDVFSIKAAIDSDINLRADTVAVGSFGKHLSHGDSNSQLAKLITLKDRGLETVTMMWDGEPAAINAAIDAAMLIGKYGIKARVAILPPGLDPNEMSITEVVKCIYEAVSINKLTALQLKIRHKV